MTLQNTQKKVFKKHNTERTKICYSLHYPHEWTSNSQFSVPLNYQTFPWGATLQESKWHKSISSWPVRRKPAQMSHNQRVPSHEIRGCTLKTKHIEEKDTTQFCSLVKNQYKRLVLGLWVWSVGVCLVRLFLWAGRCGRGLFLLFIWFLL